MLKKILDIFQWGDKGTVAPATKPDPAPAPTPTPAPVSKPHQVPEAGPKKIQSSKKSFSGTQHSKDRLK